MIRKLILALVILAMAAVPLPALAGDGGHEGRHEFRGGHERFERRDREHFREPFIGFGFYPYPYYAYAPPACYWQPGYSVNQPYVDAWGRWSLPPFARRHRDQLQGSPVPVERLDHRAVSPLARCAPCDRCLQNALHPAEVRDLGSHVLEVSIRDDPNLGARALALIREPEQRPHLTNGEPKRTGATNEGQSLELVGAVQAVASRTPSRSGQQRDPLIVADRLDVRARVLRQPTDGDPTRSIHARTLPGKALDSGVSTDSTLIAGEEETDLDEPRDQDRRRAW